MKVFLRRIILGLIPYSWLICVLFVAGSYFAFKPAIKLITKISTNFSDLLPESYPSVKLGNEVKQKFKKKGGGDLILLFESPDPAHNHQARADLVNYLQAIPEVENVKFKKENYDFFDKYKLLYMELEDLQKIRERTAQKIQREKLGGLYIDFESVDSGKQVAGEDPFAFDDMMAKYREEYMSGVKSPYHTNADETIFALWIYPVSRDTSLAYYKKFFNLISQKIQAFPQEKYGKEFKIYYAGSIKTRIDEYTTLMGDLKRAGLISLVGIFVLLMVFYRRPVGVLLLFIPLSSGILLGFALCSFFIPTLNVITSFLFSILFGLGIDIGIHMYSRYIEDRESGINRDQSIINILFKAGRSSAIATLTTIATFFVLVLNDFKGFSDFGWIAGIGLLITLATYLVFFPALLVVAEQCHLIRMGKKRHQSLQWWLKKFPVFPHAGGVTIVCALVILFFLVLCPFTSFEWDYGVLRMHVPQTVLAKEKLKQVYGRVNSPATVIITNADEANELRKILKNTKTNDAVTPSIDKFRSSYDLFPGDQKEKIQVLRDIDVLLADDALNILKGDDRDMVREFRSAIAVTAPLEEKDIPASVKEAFFGIGPHKDQQVAFVYPLPKLELDDGRNAINFYNDVHRITGSQKTFYVVSDSIVFADVLTTMFKDTKKVIILTLACLFILLYLDFRNLQHTLLILGSLSVGIVGMMGIVVLFGWKFNFFNMVTLPVVMGMGEDNSVHIFHRFQELGKKSVMEPLLTSGMAAMMASLTTILGYAGLMFAHHPGLRSIGNFAVAGMTMCMLGSLVLLPAILQLRIAKSH